MRLLELFNRANNAGFREFKESDGTIEKVLSTAQLSDGSTIEIFYHPNYSFDGLWGMAFSRSDEKGNARFDVTKQGKELEVFSTVLSNMRAFIDQYQPAGLEFTSDDDAEDDPDKRRSKLYTSLLRKYAPSNYTVEIDPYYQVVTTFRLTRKQ